MPISSLVIHLVADAERAGDLERLLAADPRVTLGARCESRLPIVLDTADRSETNSIFDAIRSHREVRHVDVVFVEVDAMETSETAEGAA